ncbi:hypothetical protein [uncultured Veillonella sp.]|uniref:hypothetical protein n=1 Tax=uncultured Veillonella sp. TaxID=159268 RepID=UPI0025F44740|nr:hypothetical protein [uncultured Veillonella sp.]
MNDKQFTDNFFKTMYELGYRKAEIEKGYIFFYEKPVTLDTWVPRIPTKCTCFTDEPQCIDIAEYLGVVDWSKVKVDTPVLVSLNDESWFCRYFAGFKNGIVYTWSGGATSWSVREREHKDAWGFAKLAEV